MVLLFDVSLPKILLSLRNGSGFFVETRLYVK